MVSPRAMFLAPDVSTTFPHGAAPANSSYDLSLAVDAAIVNIQQQGIDEKIRLANMPFGALQRAWIPSTGCPSRPSALHPHLPPLPLSLIFRAPFRPLVLLAPLVI